MKITKKLLLMLVVSMICAKSAQAFPRDSYLQYSVSTVPELVREIRAQPVVGARYARLYHASESTVESYFSENLIVAVLPHNYKHEVYCIKPNGNIYVVTEIEAKGTHVFTLKSGEPFLRWTCGNPFTHELVSPKHIAVTKVSSAKKVHTPFPYDADQVNPLNNPYQPKLVPVPPPVAVNMPNTFTATPPESISLSTQSTAPATFVSSGSSSNDAFLGLIPLIGAGILLSDHHDSGGSGVAAPAPELGSGIILLVGGLFLVAVVILRKK